MSDSEGEADKLPHEMTPQDWAQRAAQIVALHYENAHKLYRACANAIASGDHLAADVLCDRAHAQLREAERAKHSFVGSWSRWIAEMLAARESAVQPPAPPPPEAPHE